MLGAVDGARAGDAMRTAVERQRRVESGLWQEPVTHPLAPMTTTIEAAMARHRVPGCAVAVISAGQIAWARGYGVAASDAAEPVAVGDDTLFQACSISKPVAALAALRLVQAGRLDLDEDVNAYLTSWRVPANGTWQPRVTLRHLLSHTAGLTTCWYPGYRRGAALPTILQTLRGEAPANTPPVRVTALPGTQFRYSGSHFSVLQRLLVDVEGQPFDALLRESVFAPLGMDSSGYEVDFPERHPGATASGHDAGGEPIAGGWRAMPESAGAGLWTTPADLCRLACDVMAAWSGRPAQLLDRETARQMLTAQVGGWGLGWTVEQIGGALRCGHGGSNIGYKCRLVFWPERGVGAAVMTNADDGSALVGEILDAIGREYGWPDATGTTDQAGVTIALASLAGFAGEWTGEGLARLTIAVADGRLLLGLAGQPPLPLSAIGEAAFIAEVVNAEVRFERHEVGAVDQLIVRQRGEELRFARAE